MQLTCFRGIYCKPKYFSNLKIIAIIVTQRKHLVKLSYSITCCVFCKPEIS